MPNRRAGSKRSAQKADSNPLQQPLVPDFRAPQLRRDRVDIRSRAIDCDGYREILHVEFVDRLHAEVGKADSACAVVQAASASGGAGR